MTRRRRVALGLVIAPVGLLCLYASTPPVLRMFGGSRVEDRICEMNLQEIASMTRGYCERTNHVPASMQELLDYTSTHSVLIVSGFRDGKEVTDPAIMLRCPREQTETGVSYEIVLRENELPPWRPSEVIAREVHPNHRGKRAVAYGDGHVSFELDRNER